MIKVGVYFWVTKTNWLILQQTINWHIPMEFVEKIEQKDCIYAVSKFPHILSLFKSVWKICKISTCANILKVRNFD